MTFGPMMGSRRTMRAFGYATSRWRTVEMFGPRVRRHRPMSPDSGMTNRSCDARRDGEAATMRPLNSDGPYPRARIADVSSWRRGDVRHLHMGRLSAGSLHMTRLCRARLYRVSVAYRPTSWHRRPMVSIACSPGSAACRGQAMGGAPGSNSRVSSGRLPECNARFLSRAAGTASARRSRRGVMRRLDRRRGRTGALARFARSRSTGAAGWLPLYDVRQWVSRPHWRTSR